MIIKRRRVKSRKKITHDEALDKISNLMMELQAEKEMRIALMQPIDKTMKLIFTLSGIDDIEQAKQQNEENMDFIQWKMHEDYGRFVKPGTHSLSAYPYSFTKISEELEE